MPAVVGPVEGLRVDDFGGGVHVVELLRRAPLRDPLMLRIGTSQMLLRASEANRVLVRPL